jgi:uncharacterized protein (TIRG00374 family)
MEEIKIANKQYSWAKIVFGLLVVILAAVLYFDRNEVIELMFNAHWDRLSWAVIFTFTSLFFGTYGFYVICREVKMKVEPSRLFVAGAVTIAINALIASASTAAFSLRIILLRKKDVSAKEIFSASMLHSYFNLLIIILFLPFSSFFLLADYRFPLGDKITFIIFGAVMIFVFVLATWIFFSQKMRQAAINFFLRLTKLFNNKYHGTLFSDFRQVLDDNIFSIDKKSVFGIITLATFLDWLFTLFSLWVCFWALGINLPFGVLLVGFFVGIVIGFVSIIPGGIGIQEGSMAGVYALLGVHFSQAIIAVLLFRLIYYVIPFVPAVILYGGLLKKIKKENFVVN